MRGERDAITVANVQCWNSKTQSFEHTALAIHESEKEMPACQSQCRVVTGRKAES